MHVIVNDPKSVFTKQTEWTSCILNIVQHDIATFKIIKLHASIHLLYFTMAFAVSEQIQTASKPYSYLYILNACRTKCINLHFDPKFNPVFLYSYF